MTITNQNGQVDKDTKIQILSINEQVYNRSNYCRLDSVHENNADTFNCFKKYKQFIITNKYIKKSSDNMLFEARFSKRKIDLTEVDRLQKDQYTYDIKSRQLIKNNKIINDLNFHKQFNRKLQELISLSKLGKAKFYR